MTGKINNEHLSRQALVYIRQSSAHQIRDNRESGERQYALVERAVSLGWPRRSIKTVDQDHGSSATTAVHRDGFKGILADTGTGQVGIVLALETSRLARSSADWQRLVEICVITRTVLADEGTVYDPRDPNDRLLLGVKGTIAEAELFTLRSRLHEGRWSKARRGELTRSLPVGYVYDENHRILKDPDRKVRSRLDYLFDQFAQLRVARKVLLHFHDRRLKIPAKVWGGPRHGQIVWKAADYPSIVRILHNPTYAGAYVYGQSEYDSYDRSPKTGRAKARVRPMEDWPVCQQEHIPHYISWDQFLENRRMLRSNGYQPENPGAPRKGSALLQGIVYCGHCGAKMGIQHYSTKEKRSPSYACLRAYNHEGKAACQCITARVVDQAVIELFLDAVTPAKVDIAVRALSRLERDQAAAKKEWQLEIQQAEYQVELARRRYEAVDPANRMVAAELEAQWEGALKDLEQHQRTYKQFQQKQSGETGTKDHEMIKRLSGDLKSVWEASTTTMEQRKALLRILIKRVHLDAVTETGKVRIDVEWHTGAHTGTTIDRPLVGVWAPRTSEAAVQRIRELLDTSSREEIAATLNDEGFQSAKGRRFNEQTVGYIIRTRGWGRRNSKGRKLTKVEIVP